MVARKEIEFASIYEQIYEQIYDIATRINC